MKNLYYLVGLILLCGSAVLAQSNVSGTVLDAETGDPLIGVNISIASNPSAGTITDFNGSFTLNVNTGDTLVVSYIGYQTQYVPVTIGSPMNITLRSNSEVLDEVVVVGYGAQTKKEVTGSVGIVDAKTIEELNVTQVDQALQGQVAGVQITTNSGSPGSTANIRIRGISTNGDNRPLILVDGNVIEDLSVLNPSDIESIQVLKDATAGIYGVRAANGVVLITTKSGKFNQPLTIDFNAFGGIQETSRKLPVLNATQYGAIINEGFVNGGQAPPFNDLSQLGIGTDWQDEVFEVAPISNVNLTASAGTEKISYSIGGSYLNQEGIVGPKKSNFERLTGRANVTANIIEPLKLEGSIIYTYSNRSTLPENTLGSVLFNAVNMAPTFSVRDADGNYTLAEGLGNEVVNPVAQIENTFNNSRVTRLSGRGALHYQIFEYLKFTSAFQFNRATVQGMNFFPEQFYGSGKVFNIDRNLLTTSDDLYQDYTWDNFLTYERKYGQHKVNFLLGSSAFQTEGFLAGFTGFDLPTNNFDDASIDDASEVIDNYINGGDRFDVRLLSYFTRLQYDFANKYLFTASLRRDGSSAFGPENRFGYFPTFSAGWVASEEGFLDNADWIDLLKLRASFGIIGNDRIDANAFRSLLNGEGAYVFNNEIIFGSSVGRLSNPEIKWEEQYSYNVGIDLSMLRERLTFGLEFFLRETRDLLVTAPVSGILGPGAPGSSAPLINAGTIQNRGIEFQAGYLWELGKEHQLNFNFNVTALQNDVLSVNNGVGFIQGGAFGVGQSPPSRMEVGFPIGYFYGYKTEGVFQSAAELESHATQQDAGIGDLKFVDIDGDGAITEDDRTYLGDPIPDFLAGGSIQYKYRGFDLGVTVYGTFGNEVVRNYERVQPLTNKSAYSLDRWTGPNSTNEDPRQTIGATSNYLFSDYYVEDGSYLRIQNAQLGYNFSNVKWAKNLRVYVSVNNLFTFTRYRGYDPTASAGSPIGAGIDYGFYPVPRTYMLGFNAKF